MLKYRRKSDWGDYWASDPSLDIPKLLQLGHRLIHKIGFGIYDEALEETHFGEGFIESKSKLENNPDSM